MCCNTNWILKGPFLCFTSSVDINTPHFPLQAAGRVLRAEGQRCCPKVAKQCTDRHFLFYLWYIKKTHHQLSEDQTCTWCVRLTFWWVSLCSWILICPVNVMCLFHIVPLTFNTCSSQSLRIVLSSSPMRLRTFFYKITPISTFPVSSSIILSTIYKLTLFPLPPVFLHHSISHYWFITLKLLVTIK